MNSVDTVPGKNRQGVEARRLILDFIMRSPAPAAYGMVCAVFLMFGVFFPFALAIFILGPALAGREGIVGTVKCLRTLPISQKTLGRTLWLEGVVLFPFFVIAWIPLVVLLTFLVDGPSGMNWDLLSEPLLMSLVLMGCCGAAMLVVSSVFTSKSGLGKTGNLLPALVGGVWLLFCMERIFEDNFFVLGHILNSPMDFAVLAGAPVMMALSYFCYVVMTFGGPASTIKASSSSRPAYTRSRLGARAGFWVTQVLYVLAMMLMFAAVFVLIPVLLGAGWPGESRMKDYARIAILLSPLMTLVWFNSLRALRPLPMTALRLTLFLLAIPTVTVGIMTATLTAVFMGLGDSVMAWHCVMTGLAGIGLGCSICTAFARYGQNVAVVVGAVVLGGVFELLTWINLFSLVFIVGAFFFLWHTVKSSSRAYKHKPVNPFR